MLLSCAHVEYGEGNDQAMGASDGMVGRFLLVFESEASTRGDGHEN